MLGLVQAPEQLLLSLPRNSRLTKLTADLHLGLPDLTGRPIRIFVQPQLTAHRGRLLSRHPHKGVAIHAASFIRERRIVLETQLLRKTRLLRLILVHEIFHFVWARLGNRKRAEYAAIIQHELASGAGGELGESSDVKKTARGPVGAPAWRDYVCESFCDTAAFLYAGVAGHATFTLAQRWIARRRKWFQETFTTPCRF